MKKILSILLALTMVLCLGLTACNNKNTENNEQNNEVSDNAGLAEYFANIETLAEKHLVKDALDSEVLATVGGLPISAANVRYTTFVLKAPGQLSEEETKKEIETFYKQNAALVKVAYENGIELTEKNINELGAAVSTMKMQLGDAYEEEFAKQPFTQFFYYFQTSLYQSLYTNLFEKALGDKESEMAKSAYEEATADMVRAKHILIQFPEVGEGENGALTDAQKEATLAEANEVLEKVNSMADISEFDALIKEYNDDPGMETFTDGYYFTKGEMVPEFEEAAYALEEGKTSGLVETSYGYHILLKLPVEENAAGIYDSNIYRNIMSTKVYEAITKVADELVVEYSEEHDARVEDFVKEYNDSQVIEISPEDAASAAELEAEEETATDAVAE